MVDEMATFDDKAPSRPGAGSTRLSDTDALNKLALNNVALVTSFGAACLTAIRLLRAAHGDAPTAVGIVQHSGTGTVLAGLIVTFVPTLLPLLAITAYLYRLTGTPAVIAFL